MFAGLFHRTRPAFQSPLFWYGVLATLVFVSSVIFAMKLSDAYCEYRFSLISPFSRCRAGTSDTFMKGYEEFSLDLDNWIDQQRSSGTISGAAVYFRDMENGPWFGINEEDDYMPASLFKVPVMMTILKEAESDPAIMTQKLGVDRLPEMSTDTDDPNRTIVAGQYYSVEELLKRMIMYSDNQSMDLLSKRLASIGHNEDIARGLYRQLGLLPADDAQTVTVRVYASLFRILYNARYLTAEDSQRALGILAGSDFKHAIVAGLPVEMKVAHKFGIRNIEGDRLLHDCGIIYHPVRPYLLCVMTRGNDIERSAQVIAEISRRVYSQVNQNIIPSW